MKTRPNGGKPHPNSKDKTGMVFGRLTVLYRILPAKDHLYYWMCKCQCGNEVAVSSRHLNPRSLHTQSCGCLQREEAAARMTTHGKSKTSDYSNWHKMKRRCGDSSDPAYKHYGGRGIKILWKGFSDYFEHMGEKPAGLTIDRINNDGNYEPGNCRWATRKEQNRNRRDNVIFTVRGITGCMSFLAEKFGLRTGTVWHRLRKGKWEIEKAFTTPPLQ